MSIFQKREYAQIDTNASTMDLCWVGIGKTKNSMKIETRIKVWVERNKKHGYVYTDGIFQKHEYAQIDTNTSTMDLYWVGIGETKNSMKIETRIGILGLGYMGTWEYYFIMSAILNSKSPKPQHFTNSFVLVMYSLFLKKEQ